MLPMCECSLGIPISALHAKWASLSHIPQPIRKHFAQQCGTAGFALSHLDHETQALQDPQEGASFNNLPSPPPNVVFVVQTLLSTVLARWSRSHGESRSRAAAG